MYGIRLAAFSRHNRSFDGIPRRKQPAPFPLIPAPKAFAAKLPVLLPTATANALISISSSLKSDSMQSGASFRNHTSVVPIFLAAAVFLAHERAPNLRN